MTTEDFSQIHFRYCKATGRSLPYTMTLHFRWVAWANQKWTEDDLMLVIRFIQKRMKEGRRFDESLRPHNLLDVDRFAMDLADARAESRRPVQSHRSKALESIGRPEADKDKVQSAEQVMRGSAALQELLKLRDSL